MLRMYFPLLCLALMALGCIQKPERHTSVRETQPAVTEISILNLPVQADSVVLQEDARNFDLFFSKALGSVPGLKVVLDQEASQKARLSMLKARKNDLLRELSQSTGFQALVQGKLHEYSYRLENNKLFVQTIDFSLAFIDPNNSSVFCEKREKVNRSYRLSGQEAGDFTAYNQKTLEVLLTRLEKSFQRPLSAWMREQSSKKPEISEKPSLWSFSQTPKEETQASAGPVPDIKISNSRAVLPERKQDESSEAEEIIAESIPLTDAKMVSRKAVLEKKVPAPNLSESEGNVQNNLLDRGFQELEMPKRSATSPGILNLELQGYQLLHPVAFDQNKKYETYHFVPTGGIPEANNEATLEVFATVDTLALEKFMLDYFQGIQPTPLGGLTLVYEKYQMGKVQFGFEVNGRACILSAPRKQREKLLQAAAGFYRKNRNAAVTTQIAQTTGSLPAKKRKRSVLKASQSPVQVKAKPMPTKDTEEPEPDSTSKEDVKAIEKPLPPTSFSTKNPQPEALSESQPKESASFKPSGTTVAANAVFFFDMAQRYLSSRDYESACKYAKLARDQGYTGDDLLRVMNQCQAQISTTPSPSANTPSNDKPVLEYAEETPAPKITAPAPSIASQSAPTTNQPYLIEEAEFRNRTEPTTDIRRREFMDQFYSEMDSIEKELEKIKKKKNNLLLLGASGSQLSFVDLLIEGCLLLSLSAGIFYFILSKKVK